ncbi:MAG TPA: heavy metal-binding domain-containing protein [Segetibacter sp.]
MKILSNLRMISVVSLTLVFVACNNTGEADKPHATDTTLRRNADEQTYACPMHPDVTGKEGDTCPKCGMKLEQVSEAIALNNVKMQFTTIPATVNPKQEVTLSMTPKFANDNKKQVPLDVVHEKKIHLIIVNDDLSYFNHIHPELNGDGSYTIKHEFPEGGKYTLFADYKPTGSNHAIVDYLSVNVTGTVPASQKYGADKLVSETADGFRAELIPAGGKFVTNIPMSIKGKVMKNGKEVDVNTLENYLGAKAHMVVVSLAAKKYLHVHPGVKGGSFDLHTTFEKAGVYRGWIQYQSNNKVYTNDFTINVAEGAANKASSEHAGH